jgi:hypothetical protein
MPSVGLKCRKYPIPKKTYKYQMVKFFFPFFGSILLYENPCTKALFEPQHLKKTF